MSYRNDWVAAKKGMDKEKIDTNKMFKKKLGEALDGFEKAAEAFAKTKGIDQAKLDAAKKKRLDAANKALPLIQSYLKDLEFFEKGLGIAPKQKAAVEHAKSVLTVDIYGEIRRTMTGIG